MKNILIEPNPKQRAFFESTAKYTAYGGARGGGKSWAMRIKLILLALNYDGIQILLLRRTLAELRENHLLPMAAMLKGAATYIAGEKEFRFRNGSRIRLGYCDSEGDVLQFQGQAYEVIGMEEATHFTEFQFNALTESNRLSGQMKQPFSPRMYFTCNPGGVGHDWVKRRFIDREYRGSENPEDYVFIKSLVFDNRYLMDNDQFRRAADTGVQHLQAHYRLFHKLCHADKARKLSAQKPGRHLCFRALYQRGCHA